MARPEDPELLFLENTMARMSRIQAQVAYMTIEYREYPDILTYLLAIAEAVARQKQETTTVMERHALQRLVVKPTKETL